MHPAGNNEVFYVESKRRARVRKAQMFQHIAIAFILIANGASHLQDHFSVLPALEVVAGVALVVAAVIEKRRKSKGAHSKIGWFEIAAAGLVFVEALARTAEPKSLAFKILNFIPPILLLLVGIFEVRLSRLAAARVNDDGLSLRMGPFRTQRLRWEGIRFYRLVERGIEFLDADRASLKTLVLTDVINRAEAEAWLVERIAARGIAHAESAELSSAAASATSTESPRSEPEPEAPYDGGALPSG